MTGLSGISRDDEVANSSYVQSVIVVGTTQVEAKVSASPLSGRQMLRIYNKSNSTIYIGPDGVTISTGEPLEKNNWINIPAGEKNSVFLIAGSSGNDVVVSEWS